MKQTLPFLLLATYVGALPRVGDRPLYRQQILLTLRGYTGYLEHLKEPLYYFWIREKFLGPYYECVAILAKY
jgi:hypothetical protein